MGRELIFYERKTPFSTLLTLEGEVASLPSVSGSGERVQSCLSSTREMSDQKVSVSMEPCIIKFFAIEGVQPTEISKYPFIICHSRVCEGMPLRDIITTEFVDPEVKKR